MAHSPVEALADSGADIALYTKSNCVQCNATKRHLDKAEVAYEVIDIESDQEAFDYVTSELDHKQAPVVVASIRGRWRHWSGFNPAMLDEAIESVTDGRYTANIFND